MASKTGQIIQNFANSAQIIALIVAGFWAYSRWTSETLPSLKPTLKIDSGIEVFWSEAFNSCALESYVSAENVSLQDIDISAVYYYFGYLDIKPLEQDEEYRFIQPDLRNLDQVNLVFTSDLVGLQPPNTVSNESLEIIFRPVPKKVAAIYISLMGPYGEDGAEEEIAYVWNYAHSCQKPNKILNTRRPQQRWPSQDKRTA